MPALTYSVQTLRGDVFGGLTAQEPDPEAVEALLGEDHSPEAIAIDGADACVWTPDGVMAMTLSYAYLEKRFGVVATARNWNTIRKIVAKL